MTAPLHCFAFGLLVARESGNDASENTMQQESNSDVTACSPGVQVCVASSEPAKGAMP